MCGVLGICAPDRDVARLAHFGLHALQHRGQESAGIAVSNRGHLTVLREMGLVAQVFNEQNLGGLEGQLAIGHTRYSTTGSAQWSNAQPIIQHGRARTVALGHNGNLVNAGELREELKADGIKLGSSSDTELIAALIANDPAPLEQAVVERDGPARRRLLGERALRREAPRLPRPARLPAARARALHDGYAVASETCALDLIGAEPERELGRGELLVIDEEGVHARQAVPAAEGALCIFEFFYLARPDTRLEGVEVHAARVRMGERLAEEAPVEADLVLPIPDSGTPAAIGFARATKIPFSEGLIKNRYIGRTFIQPDQEMRQQGIRLKFNPLAEVAGKRVVVVDDSIVRGNTTRQIVAMLFDAGATEVHVRISSPPVIGPCFYGIDLADPEQLIASSRTVDEVRESIGATSLAYISLEGLQWATARPGVVALPRLPHRAVPDADPGGSPAREAPVRAREGLAACRSGSGRCRPPCAPPRAEAAPCRPSGRTGACRRRARPGRPST